MESDLDPAMTAAEAALLRAAARGCGCAVEYGAGGSTPLLLEEAGFLVSVESDPGWLQRLRARPACAAAEAEGRWRPIHADVGPVGDWGWPRNPLADGGAYARAPWDAAPAPGFVLVDGRWRVACALMALERVGPHGLVAVHDFWDRAPYRVLLDAARLEGSTGSLVLLRPRTRASRPDPAAFLHLPL